MRYEEFEKQPEITCECELPHARPDGNKRCGAPVHKMHNGRYMCQGHYYLARQREESMAQVKRDMEGRVQIKEKNDGRDWARRIIARHEAGELVPSIALNMAKSVTSRDVLQNYVEEIAL